MATKADGDLAKKLRNGFAADHCRAVWITMPDAADIPELEAAVIAIAPEHATAWNRRRMEAYDGPTELDNATLQRLEWGAQELAAIDRECTQFLGRTGTSASIPLRQAAPALPRQVKPFPKGPFRFVSLDVETANNGRGSICQIGVACVRRCRVSKTWRSCGAA